MKLRLGLTALGVALSFASLPARSAVPPVLDEAIGKNREEEGRWAFTETTEVRDAKGNLKQSVVLQCDPSKPYGEQYKAVAENGKPPSKKLQKECRDRGEKEAVEREKAAQEISGMDEGLIPIQIGDDRGVVDLNAAVPAEENDKYVVYKVPVRAKDSSKFPFDRIEVRAMVAMKDHSLDGLRFSISAPFRATWFAKVKGAEISADFTPAGEGLPSLASRIEVHAIVSLVLFRVEQRIVVVRSDFRKVKPYDERFSVKMGPLKTIGF